MLRDLPLTLTVSLVLTLLLEGLFAFCAGQRTGRRLLLVALVNTLTNPVVVLLHALFPSMLLTLFLELSAVLVEGFVYKKCADNIRHPFLFSLAINAFSYFSGELLNRLLNRLLPLLI